MYLEHKPKIIREKNRSSFFAKGGGVEWLVDLDVHFVAKRFVSERGHVIIVDTVTCDIWRIKSRKSSIVEN